MTFLWPDLLWLLLAVPLLVLAYWLLLRRKKKIAVRYAALTMVRDAQGPAQRIRRHVPPALFLVALTLMIVAIARPQALVLLPSQHETIILAMDVSGSMRAADVEPNRLVAAQNAARAFVNDQPAHTRVGIVSFAGTAAVVQPPTRTREDILAAIDRFQLQRGTAVGSGILVSLKTIFPDAEFDLRSWNPRGEKTKSGPLDRAGRDDKAPARAVPPGSFKSAAIILLTDGQTTTGPDPIESARMAAERGIRVYTVGIGTEKGEMIGAEGWSMRVRLDEASLKQIANVTQGEYFYAGNATDLRKVYESLSSKLVFERRQSEVTALFAAAAALFAVLAAALSMLWFGRIM
ncbi:MAG: VWA domain-containing protein [Betaproteobacteria bacterium]|nr:VWA domain-containing protein [Betaproteobacteria bacterium]MCC7215394.1 VWA domain-containing protein [Burkholderiales bacterium]